MKSDVKAVAQEAYKLFSYNSTRVFGFKVIAVRHAIAGYFKGVADGTINVGQGWVGQEIMKLDVVLDEDRKMIETIFSTGMCCEGQRLLPNTKSTFKDRI